MEQRFNSAMAIIRDSNEHNGSNNQTYRNRRGGDRRKVKSLIKLHKLCKTFLFV